MPEKNSAQEGISTKINFYDPLKENVMQHFYNQLSEKDKRLYAGAEAIKLPYGGITYIAKLFGCDRKTVSRGIMELQSPDLLDKDRIRKKGGGRKKSIESITHLDEKFIMVIWNHTAGDPMDEKVRWTNLTHQQIADKLKEEGVEVSKKIVKQLFKRHGYVKRKAVKTVSTGTCKDRNEQFENISSLISQYKIAGNPVISVDTKKKKC